MWVGGRLPNHVCDEASLDVMAQVCSCLSVCLCFPFYSLLKQGQFGGILAVFCFVTFISFCVYMYMCTTVCAWRSEDNLWKSVLSCGSGAELRSSGLEANAFTC